MDLDEKVGRESRFWDARQEAPGARDVSLYRVGREDRHDRSVPWLPYLGFDKLVQCALDALAPLQGKRVLDLGSGTGFLAALLALNGAEVEAVDVSRASLDVARWRAEISGVAERIRFHVMPAERLSFPDESFDLICGTFVLHHLELAVAAPELRRVLRPGSRGAFIETCGRSLLLMTARRLLTGRLGIEKASSDDEAPLGASAQVILARSFGGSVRMEYPTTLVFRMMSYVPPLHTKLAQGLLAGLDRMVHRVPALRSQSYYGLVTFRRD